MRRKALIAAALVIAVGSLAADLAAHSPGEAARAAGAVRSHASARDCLLDPDCPHVLFAAHRQGFARRAGENSLSAFRAQLGNEHLDVFELDVRMTSDGHLVLMHDPTVDRTTNGTGRVCDLTLGAIRSLRLDGLDEPPPTLDEVLAVVGRAKPLVIDPKGSSLRAVWDVLRRHGAEDQAVLFVNGDPAIREVNRMLGSGLRPLFMPRLQNRDDIREFLGRFVVPPPIVHIDVPTCRPDVLEAIRESGARAYMHFPKKPPLGLWWKSAGIALIEQGVTLFDTDDPDDADELVREYRRVRHPRAVRATDPDLAVAPRGR